MLWIFHCKVVYVATICRPTAKLTAWTFFKINSWQTEAYLSPFLSSGVSEKHFYNAFPNKHAKINNSQSKINLSLLDNLYLFQWIEGCSHSVTNQWTSGDRADWMAWQFSGREFFWGNLFWKLYKAHKSNFNISMIHGAGSLELFTPWSYWSLTKCPDIRKSAGGLWLHTWWATDGCCREAQIERSCMWNPSWDTHLNDVEIHCEVVYNRAAVIIEKLKLAMERKSKSHIWLSVLMISFSPLQNSTRTVPFQKGIVIF